MDYRVFGYSWSTLLWHRCYYPHRSRDALSPVCGIFLRSLCMCFQYGFPCLCQVLLGCKISHLNTVEHTLEVCGLLQISGLLRIHINCKHNIQRSVTYESLKIIKVRCISLQVQRFNEILDLFKVMPSPMKQNKYF